MQTFLLEQIWTKLNFYHANALSRETIQLLEMKSSYKSQKYKKFKHAIKFINYLQEKIELWRFKLPSNASFQQRSPKVCPDSAQIFFKFLLVSMKRINNENFSPIPFLLPFLQTCFFFFRKLKFDIGIKSGFGQLIFSNTTRKINQTT